MNTSPVIGLVGGIGAGKSAVASILREFGCVVANSDELARAELNHPDVRDALVRWWGQGILLAGVEPPQVNRSAVAKIVFADQDQRHRLEELIHPRVEARRRAVFAAAPPGTPAVVIDAPLLLEAGLAGECDAIIFVDVAPRVRQERLQRNRGWTEAELIQREASQLPLDQKRSRADYVVRNDGDLAALRDQVEPILADILNRRHRR